MKKIINLLKQVRFGGSPFTGVLGWIDNRLPLPRILLKEYIVFQVPRNLNYLYSFGGILMICLVTLIVTGLILGMHYKADTALAFDSIERIMRDVNHGWLVRYIHMNMASFSSLLCTFTCLEVYIMAVIKIQEN